ncbi:16S ribosomal RNA methyltransferase RsmE [compost metagenome]
MIEPRQRYLILIGPEGDFSPKEIELALQCGFKPLTLGNTRLRTETAALAACFEVNYLNR